MSRSFGDVGSMSGLPESGHGWAIESAVGGRAERPTKKSPAGRGASNLGIIDATLAACPVGAALL
jgi:hypothetical protein